MANFTADHDQNPIKCQQWVPKQVRDDDGMYELLGYEATVRPADLQAVRNGLWDLGINYHTDPGNKVVISQDSIPLFEKTFPDIIGRDIAR